ncbi:MAG: histidine--tRNA ligase [Candidatus Woykebacteria bacterium RBG_13_40_15]|uniref:Histidine--tRNA ligase n=1 Tax=Candidatus Woykebacteria bacterium RBG_13_40_15 TaxID=1802593 RepID=A0A1G1W655_9BACT|nr:MAG: histidine--tRNA ligase [Candidatus Woykebacteria bacterium RBG_13_40_15]
MTKSSLQTPKGFRDFLPEQSSRRRFVVEKIRGILENFGFEPLETPTLEYAELLKGKYGEEEKLIFEFTDRGGRDVALPYDRTVPLARVLATNQNLSKPFKRYQIQASYRADNPQKGRFREFTQIDFDILGSNSLVADAEVIVASLAATKEVGFEKYILRVNDRKNFQGLPIEAIRAIDKLAKVGEYGVIDQLKRVGYDTKEAKALLKRVKNSSPTKQVKDLFKLLENYKVETDKYAFDPTLARGLDYYTGIVYEIEVEGYPAGSVGGGGRYDDLIGRFANGKTPAVGFAFGLDRLIEAAEELNLLDPYKVSSRVLVTVFNEKLLKESLSLVSLLRKQGVPAEISLDPNDKLEKQLKYADNKGIPYVAILGPEEVKTKTLTLKDLASGEQKNLKIGEVIREIK